MRDIPPARGKLHWTRAGSKKQRQQMWLKRSLSASCLANFIRYTMPGYQLSWFHQEVCCALDEFLNGVERQEHPRLIITAPPQHGKAAADSTPVLTADGWRTHGELKPGCFVFGPDGKAAEVLAVGPQTWITHELEFKSGERIKVHLDHEWTVVDRATGKTGTVETRWLLDYADKILTRFYIPMADAAEPAVLWTVHGLDEPEPGRCIQVDREDGLYRVGERQIPTHNSEIISRRFPAYALGKFPDMQIIATSYSASLAARTNREVQNIIMSARYKELFPETVLMEKGVGAKGVYTRTSAHFDIVGRKGSYHSAGVGGSITGMGGHCLLIDDPIRNQEEARSRVMRDKLWDWYRTVFRTRQGKGAGIAIIHTRWHEDDLIGRILENKGGEEWKVLNFPAIAESSDEFRQAGDPLWPEKYDLKALETERDSMSGYEWAALYQQRPAPDDGQIFKREWFKYWTVLPDKFDWLLISWDMSFKDSAASDFVVGQVWGKKGADCYLADQIRRRMSFTETCDAVVSLAERWPGASRKLVEATANGPAVIDALKHKIQGIIPVKPEGSKVSRAYAVSGLFESGNVYLPDPARHKWVKDYVTELLSFPVAVHDDQVDATTQALRKLIGYSSERRIISMRNPILSSWDMAW